MKAWGLVVAHLGFYWRRTTLLVGCLLISCLVPIVLSQVMPELQQQLRRRAETTPVVFGGRGSSLELALHALYFRGAESEALTFGDWQRFQRAGFQEAVPLHVRFQAEGFPIVGTHLEYFQLRGLRISRGETFARLGDCVLGHEVAGQLQLGVGDTLISSPQSILSIAADYPLQMNVVGILQPQSSPDDRAVFVDLKTAWVIENLGHGHEDVTASSDPNLILERTRQGTVASAAVLPYTVVTDENLASFHFHGDMATFPITAIVLLVDQQRQQDLAAGFSQRLDGVQTVFAAQAVEELLAMLFQIQNLILAISLFVGLATLSLFGLVIGLTIHIRRSEMETMYKLGASRGLTFSLYGLEVLVILVIALGLAGLLARWAAWLIGQDFHTWIA